MLITLFGKYINTIEAIKDIIHELIVFYASLLLLPRLLLFQMHFFFIRNNNSFAARNNFVIGEQFIIFTYTYIGRLQETRKCTAIIFILRIILFLSIWQTTLINIIAVSKSESEQWKKAARCEDKFQTISKATKKRRKSEWNYCK